MKRPINNKLGLQHRDGDTMNNALQEKVKCQKFGWSARQLLISCLALLVMTGCGNNSKSIKPIARLAIISFGSVGEDYSDMYLGKGRKFADVTREVGSVVYIYGSVIRKNSPRWFAKFLPLLFSATVKDIESSGKLQLVATNEVERSRVYQAIKTTCSVPGALTAEPSLAFLAEECMKDRLTSLQEDLRADALVSLDCEVQVSNLMIKFIPHLKVYQGGSLVQEFGYYSSMITARYLDERNPWKSRNSFASSLKEVLIAAVPGVRATGEEAERTASYIEAKLLELPGEAGGRIAKELLGLVEGSRSE